MSVNWFILKLNQTNVYTKKILILQLTNIKKNVSFMKYWSYFLNFLRVEIKYEWREDTEFTMLVYSSILILIKAVKVSDDLRSSSSVNVFIKIIFYSIEPLLVIYKTSKNITVHPYSAGTNTCMWHFFLADPINSVMNDFEEEL